VLLKSDKVELKGYVWAFVANAQRVANDFPAAAATFAKAWTSWRKGESEVQASPFPEWRLFDLEASLFRDQRQFDKALQQLDKAFAAAPPEAHGHILLNKAFALEQATEVGEALEVLEQAAPLVGAAGNSSLRWSLEMNRIVLNAHLRRFDDAQARLPALRNLARERGKRLDLIRVQWLTGRVAAGFGRQADAYQAMEQARRDFEDCGHAFEAALVSLEIAVLDLAEGRLSDAAVRAEEMLPIFRSQHVSRECLAAVTIFCKAARLGTATVEEARRLLRDLELARPASRNLDTELV
jgi:tetratricopeptide (TPR) repeat protein